MEEENIEELEVVEVLDEAESHFEEEADGEEEEMEVQEEAGAEEVEDCAFFAFKSHTDAVYCSSFHPTIDGLVITGGGDDRAFLWQYATNEETELTRNVELSGHTDSVTAVGFNFNGSLVLTGSYDGTVRVWDVQSGALLQTLEGPDDVEWAKWHSKGNAIIAGSKDGTIWMWLAHNGQCMQVFAGHDEIVSCGSFSTCGKFVCSAGEDGTVRVWSPKTGACLHVFEGHIGHASPITCMAVADDLILTGSQDGQAKLFQISGKRLLNTFVHSNLSTINEEEMKLESTNGVECVGFSHEQFRWIATGGLDKLLKVWDMSSGSCRVTCAHDGGVVSLKWHPLLPFVCTGTIDAVVRVWDARNGVCTHLLTGHTNMVTSIDLKISSPELGTIISVSDDSTARLFNVVFEI